MIKSRRIRLVGHAALMGEEYIQGFGRRIWKKETTRKIVDGRIIFNGSLEE
jgi:hypothetical protein